VQAAPSHVRWVAACAVAETVGIATAGALTVVSLRLDANAAAGLVATLPLMAVVGLVEGGMLGTLQSRALGDLLPRGARARYVLGTVVVAVSGWVLASLPTVLAGDELAATEEPPLALVLPLASLLGAALGAVMGAVQWAVLRRFVARVRWILANVAGWALAMPVIFLPATMLPAGSGVGTAVLWGAGGGLLAGLGLGLVTAPVATRAHPPPVRLQPPSSPRYAGRPARGAGRGDARVAGLRRCIRHVAAGQDRFGGTRGATARRPST
jgi:hypothetical protein